MSEHGTLEKMDALEVKDDAGSGNVPAGNESDSPGVNGIEGEAQQGKAAQHEENEQTDAALNTSAPADVQQSDDIHSDTPSPPIQAERAGEEPAEEEPAEEEPAEEEPAEEEPAEEEPAEEEPAEEEPVEEEPAEEEPAEESGEVSGEANEAIAQEGRDEQASTDDSAAKQTEDEAIAPPSGDADDLSLAATANGKEELLATGNGNDSLASEAGNDSGEDAQGQATNGQRDSHGVPAAQSEAPPTGAAQAPSSPADESSQSNAPAASNKSSPNSSSVAPSVNNDEAPRASSRLENQGVAADGVAARSAPPAPQPRKGKSTTCCIL